VGGKNGGKKGGNSWEKANTVQVAMLPQMGAYEKPMDDSTILNKFYGESRRLKTRRLAPLPG